MMTNTTNNKKFSANGRKDSRKRGKVSIYFLLWAVFSVMTVIVVLVVSFALHTVMIQTYKSEAKRELEEQSSIIVMDVTSEIPLSFNGNHSEYVRHLSSQYDANIYILELDGTVLFPNLPEYSTDQDPNWDDYSQELNDLKARIEASGEQSVLYENGDAYVFGKRITLYAGVDGGAYLYVEKPLSFIQNASKQIAFRTTMISLSVAVLAFAIGSVIASWLVKPLSKMTEKAKLLAQGDFAVDFHGSDHGREISELADTLNFARDEISKADSMQKELIANVSHDFKTPLTMIKAYASMIVEISGENKEKRDKHAQVIVDEADRLASLVGDMLDLSKLRSGIQTLKLSVVDMSAYTQEIVGRFAYLQETQGYVLKTDIQDGLFAYVDELKIGQVLYNLIGNAVNYTGEDKRVYVSLKSKEDGTGFRFAVRDTGKGIKKEEIDTIWDRYYRNGESHKRPVRGTGLGLSIVKAVLLRHGLDFGVESEPEKGSTFFVDFILYDEETENERTEV